MWIKHHNILFVSALQDKLSFHRHSIQWVQPGLYVGILKLCSSVEQIRVLVPQRLPNLLCHTRVRHNAHVSRCFSRRNPELRLFVLKALPSLDVM